MLRAKCEADVYVELQAKGSGEAKSAMGYEVQVRHKAAILLHPAPRVAPSSVKTVILSWPVSGLVTMASSGASRCVPLLWTSHSCDDPQLHEADPPLTPWAPC